MALSNTDKEWILLHLNPIKEGIKIQNGKVAKHEEQITQALVEREGNRQKQNDYFNLIEEIQGRLELVEKAEVSHLINCPVNLKLRIIEDKLLSQASVYKVMGIMFTGGIALGGLIVAIIKLWN
jgi:hypothetical protein